MRGVCIPGTGVRGRRRPNAIERSTKHWLLKRQVAPETKKKEEGGEKRTRGRYTNNNGRQLNKTKPGTMMFWHAIPLHPPLVCQVPVPGYNWGRLVPPDSVSWVESEMTTPKLKKQLPWVGKAYLKIRNARINDGGKNISTSLYGTVEGGIPFGGRSLWFLILKGGCHMGGE